MTGSACRQRPHRPGPRPLAAALLLTAALPARAAAPPLSATPAPPLQTIAAVRNLSPQQAARGLPVRIRAVVTYYHHDWEMLFVQDRTGAVFIYVDHRLALFPVRLGDLVEVEGTTVPGDFAASIAHPRLRYVETVGMPAPRQVTLRDIATAGIDAQWAEVEGTVRSAAVVDGLIRIVLTTGGGRLIVHVKDFPAAADMAGLVDARVRVRGVCSTLTNDKRQFLGAELWSPDLQDLSVQEPAPPDPFAPAPQSLDGVRRLALSGGHDRRLKVTGTVTLRQPRRGVFLQDEADAVFVETAQREPLAPGDRVEAIGFVADGRLMPTLEEGRLRRADAGPAPPPADVNAEQVQRGGHDGRLVRLQGRFEGRVAGTGEEVLIVHDGDVVFDARMAEGPLPPALAELPPGSLVQLTGVSWPVQPPGGERAFQLLLRSADDVVLRQRPSWWTVARVRWAVAALAAGGLLAFAWAGMLRVQVRAKTRALRESQERFALAVQGTNDGIWDWDLRSDRIYFSPRFKAMLGYVDEELGDTPGEWFRLVHGEDLEGLQARLARHREGKSPHFEHEYRMLHKDGSYRWVLSRAFALRDADGRASRLAGAQTDVTDRRSHDPLTGLPNRALFVERLEKAVMRARHDPTHLFAVLFLDLDRFKLVNDSLGHLEGDCLLVELAHRLEGCVRPGDMIARFGGDEFAVLVDGVTDAGDAARVAERIRKALAPPFRLGSHEVYTSVSIGIALSATGYGRGEDLLRDADAAMYRAKGGGRARFEVFDAAMRAHVTAVMQTENDLRRAVEREEFELHYQPVVALAGGTVAGIEALVRWRHPVRGLLPPKEFLRVAEETGLVVMMGEQVLRQACGQMHRWQLLYPCLRGASMGVNISARQFADPELASRIEEALRFSQLEPGAIVLEITEKAITESAEGAVALIARLKDLGVRLHVDDFGTGYSSVRYLRRFPIDALKIDRSYVATMNRNDEAGTIVRSTLSLAHILGLAVVAEGVETDEQVETLREMGCGLAQGKRFAPPLPASGVEALFATLGPGGELPPRSSSPEPAANPSKRAGTGSTAG